MPKPIMQLDSVSLTYKSRVGLFKSFSHKALEQVSFDVNEGEILGILGKNGSGKSSLLQVMAGIILPDNGSLIVKDKVSRSLLSLGLGFNLQLTGRDNATYSCMLSGLSKKETKSRLEEIKEYSELGDFFEQPMKAYSSGMKSRLGFATGVIVNVDILLIDETLSVGDSDFRAKAHQTLLSKLNGKQTVVFVSHSAKQVNRLCDRAVWLEKGKIRSIGKTKEIIKEYEAT